MSGDFLTEKDVRDFVETLPPHARRMIDLDAADSESSIELLGMRLSGDRQPVGLIRLTSNSQTERPSAWLAIKSSVYRLLCDKSGKTYVDAFDASGAIAVGKMCSSIANSVNVECAVIAPVVAVVAWSAVKVGRDAWCDVNCHLRKV